MDDGLELGCTECGRDVDADGNCAVCQAQRAAAAEQRAADAEIAAAAAAQAQAATAPTRRDLTNAAFVSGIALLLIVAVIWMSSGSLPGGLAGGDVAQISSGETVEIRQHLAAGRFTVVEFGAGW